MRSGIALSCFLTACALLLRWDEKAPRPARIAASALSGLVVAIGLYELAKFIGGDRTPLDLSLTGAHGLGYPLRMRPANAGMAAALGLALLCLDVEDRKGRRPSQALCVLVGLFTIAALGTRLFDTAPKVTGESLAWITPLTAIDLGLLALGALAARPTRGGMRVVTTEAVGGDVARRLLPAAMLAPLLLCILCYMGFRADWYDSGFGLALLTASNSTVLTALVWRTAVSLNEADGQRRAVEQERNALNARLQRSMAETHHRVRNNLQFIAALADMQVLEGRDTVPITEVQRIGAQVNALAAVHSILTRESKTEGTADRLSGAEVLGKLAEQLRLSAHGRGIVVRADDTEISGRQASALVIIVNELITNALKNSAGDVHVEFESRDGKARLVVWDEGCGFPEGFDPVRQANTGLELVQQMSSWDLQGSVRFSNRPEGGAQVVVEMPTALATAAREVAA
jgi:two-component sensor histidine kinase